jgi:DNA-binding response OmpR family regulator
MSRPKTCPCCGQVIPSDLALSRIQRRLYEALCRGPRTADELRDAAWSDDSEGGPAGWKTIYVHVYLLNRKLAPHGMAARRRWRAPYEPYHLVSLA